MDFIYGKKDFQTLDRGQENCYLLTNGLGGFSSAALTGAASRNDHALLMAGVRAPNLRCNMIHRLSESLKVFPVGDSPEEPCSFWISSQEFPDQEPEDGYRYLSSFTFSYAPKWIYQVQGIQIKKKIGMKQESNTVAVSYDICNRSQADCCLSIVPWMQFVKKGENLKEGQKFHLGADAIEADNQKVYYKTDGKIEEETSRYQKLYYAADACDGRRDQGLAAANHRICAAAGAGQEVHLEVIYSMEPIADTAADILSGMEQRQIRLEEQAGFTSPLARVLSRAADQFVAKRESTGGKTILAGYPFFEDWGRDTMIALEGCCMSTCQYDAAKSILRTFIANQKKGLMPNLFPEGGKEPAYNTADAALLFVNSVYQYYKRTGDEDFVREACPAMKEVIDWYRRGTDFGIHMDADGLLMAGQGLDQVTWMDVRVGEILPTPRHGKPVEINAYWYNALRIMEELSALTGEDEATYGKLAEQVRTSFGEQFWMEEKHCLKDVLSGTSADAQIRCNQIWAVSLPYTMLSPDREKQVVETVFEKLYTPLGLRTLAMEDEQFHGSYKGSQMDRDMAYHQGTVWVFPLGGYYLAYLKVHEYSQKAMDTVTEQLEVMESALREGCVGQLPEIYDGENPSSSRGCFAQAWSVGELLRVYEALEKGKGDEPWKKN